MKLAALVPDFKQDYRNLISYLSNQIKKQGVNVELGKEATPELILKKKLDVIIIAIGATPIIPDISGVGREQVVTAIDLLLGKKKAGE